MLHKDVFATAEFGVYAKKNLVLVEVDFPQKKKQSAALKKANEALQKQFKIEGYPTLIVLDGDGKKLGEVEFPDNTKALIASLDKLKKK